ncbi:flagellin [Idiomarina sp. WRN-38]|uniref:flagellar hook-associated protein FlgL n=1 Tax=Idiomarina sp. OXR-189 TaxID=3100175 RepID=UPI0007339D28|nr:flagellar hook-associated protein FlgL [Idiomarina sp. OXR-189]KTG24195.1 flagellin [Idiomarina sp. H105]OAE91586.1 flagellin [Idiomarina sp. WRN-38]WPZ02070.1 flagellar hook-associated protein FlgL [Idiomarina sp. OXR-189]
MRLSTNLFYQRGLDSLQTSQARLDKIQLQLTKQTKILSPADDPIGNSQVIALDEKIAQNEQFKRNSVTLENNLAREESVIQNIVDTVQRVRALAVQAGNGSYDQSSRQAIADELRDIEDAVFDLAVAKDESGEFIFAGYQNREQPMVFNSATDSYEYVSDDGQRELQLSPTLYLPAGDPGSKLFGTLSQRADIDVTGDNALVDKITISNRDDLTQFAQTRFDAGDSTDMIVNFTAADEYQIEDGDGNVLQGATAFTPGDDITFNGVTFNTAVNQTPVAGETIEYSLQEPVSRNLLTQISDLADALENSGDDKGLYESELSFALEDLDKGIGQLTDVQAGVGSRLNVLQDARLSNEDFTIVNKKARADIADVDYSTAITDLLKNETIYSASQQIFSRVSRLSLFDYL